IPLFPLLGFLFNFTVGVRVLTQKASHAAGDHGHGGGHGDAHHAPSPIIGIVACGAVALSFLFALSAVLAARTAPEHTIVQTLWHWIPGGAAETLIGGQPGAAAFTVDWAYQVDPLSSVMILVVTFVGFLIHVYSVGYMGHDRGYGRYFAYLNLFMFAMLVLVLGANFLMLFVGWEGVGLCSYLLIGYDYHKKFAADAGKKAFVVNRIGDFGFILGIFGVFALFGTLDFGRVFSAAALNPSAYAPSMTLICLLLFIGACGKSAQFPLHVWLPDAMAGPTPVSALIHAATMVTAGVYMVARCNVFFRLAPHAMIVVAVVGAFTAIFAASIGVAQNDIKKVLAYSTVSQLGYMFLACGVGAFTEGMFHVTTHAFFKACLFLGAGSVIHALGGEQDIRMMGGLARKIPRTYWTFLIASATIAGVPFLAAFFSKDAIKAAVFHAEFAELPWLPKLLYAVALFTAGLTAFYMFRLVALTFWGGFRGGKEQETHVHESPPTMTVPLIVLAFFSIVGGYVGVPIIAHGDRIGEFLRPIRLPIAGLPDRVHHAPLSVEVALMAAAVAAAGIGIFLAYAWYVAGEGRTPARLAQRFPGVYRAVSNKYFVDEAYEKVFVRGVALEGGNLFWEVDATVVDLIPNGAAAVTRGLSWIASFFDQYVVDGLVNGVGNTLQALFQLFRKAQTGRVQNYALVMGGGVFCLVAVYLLFR
ncbi:MAG TPA: NADH-quinone oxidoreductase subunit L, partial [Thermoanaerobaculia bacterium]